MHLELVVDDVVAGRAHAARRARMVDGRQRGSDVLEPLLVGRDLGAGEHFARAIRPEALVREDLSRHLQAAHEVRRSTSSLPSAGSMSGSASGSGPGQAHAPRALGIEAHDDDRIAVAERNREWPRVPPRRLKHDLQIGPVGVRQRADVGVRFEEVARQTDLVRVARYRKLCAMLRGSAFHEWPYDVDRPSPSRSARPDGP